MQKIYFVEMSSEDLIVKITLAFHRRLVLTSFAQTYEK